MESAPESTHTHLDNGKTRSCKSCWQHCKTPHQFPRKGRNKLFLHDLWRTRDASIPDSPPRQPRTSLCKPCERIRPLARRTDFENKEVQNERCGHLESWSPRFMSSLSYGRQDSFLCLAIPIHWANSARRLPSVLSPATRRTLQPNWTTFPSTITCLSYVTMDWRNGNRVAYCRTQCRWPTRLFFGLGQNTVYWIGERRCSLIGGHSWLGVHSWGINNGHGWRSWNANSSFRNHKFNNDLKGISILPLASRSTCRPTIMCNQRQSGAVGLSKFLFWNAS